MRDAGFDAAKDGVTMRIDLAGSRTADPPFTVRVAPCRVNDCAV